MSSSQDSQRDAAALSAYTDQTRSHYWLENLLGALRFDCEADPAAEDTSPLLRVIWDLSSGSENRAVALIMSPVMQQWITSTESFPLVVNGHMLANVEEIRQSPLSFFCAKLVENILLKASSQPAEGHDIFAVRWFCGQHTDFSDQGPTLPDYHAHPPVRHFADLLPTLFLLEFVSSSANADSEMLQGMLSNMIGQLAFQLLQCPLKPPELGRRLLTEEDPDLSTLCSIFAELVRSLPRNSILYIVIDGISWYEDKDEDRREECRRVLFTLTRLARRRSETTNDGCLVKLLVTAPLSSHYAQALFAPSETLNLPEYIEPNDGYTPAQWNMTNGELKRGIGVESS